jgi:uncharacterized protein
VAASGADPSMEDILASIRRILSEDEVPAAEGTAPAPPAAVPASADRSDNVLVLDPTMMVADREHEFAAAPAVAAVAPPRVAPVPVAEPKVEAEMSASDLVAPEAAAAATSAVGSLIRTLAAERSMQVHTGGPTIEDIVREELRPMLKSWLDTNLPPLVEHLVRAEIERLVGRAVP